MLQYVADQMLAIVDANCRRRFYYLGRERNVPERGVMDLSTGSIHCERFQNTEAEDHGAVYR